MDAQERFAVSTTPVDGVPTIVVTGELDPHTVDVLQAAVDGALADPAVSELVLDVAGLDFVDSSGIRVLIAAHKALESRDGRLVLRGANGMVRRLLDITGLAGVLAIEPA